MSNDIYTTLDGFLRNVEGNKSSGLPEGPCDALNLCAMHHTISCRDCPLYLYDQDAIKGMTVQELYKYSKDQSLILMTLHGGVRYE